MRRFARFRQRLFRLRAGAGSGAAQSMRRAGRTPLRRRYVLRGSWHHSLRLLVAARAAAGEQLFRSQRRSLARRRGGCPSDPADGLRSMGVFASQGCDRSAGVPPNEGMGGRRVGTVRKGCGRAAGLAASAAGAGGGATTLGAKGPPLPDGPIPAAPPPFVTRRERTSCSPPWASVTCSRSI
jgi:hypothetical protein